MSLYKASPFHANHDRVLNSYKWHLRPRVSGDDVGRGARAFPTWFDTTYFTKGLRRAEQRHTRQAVPA